MVQGRLRATGQTEKRLGFAQISCLTGLIVCSLVVICAGIIGSRNLSFVSHYSHQASLQFGSAFYSMRFPENILVGNFPSKLNGRLSARDLADYLVGETFTKTRKSNFFF